MKVYLEALGCRLNEAELGRWSRAMQGAGHAVVRQTNQAQVMVLNTCAVTSQAARRSRKLARKLHRSNPEAKLVLTGCFSSLQPEAARALDGVDLLVDNQDKDRLPQILEQALDPTAMPILAAVDPDSAHAFPEEPALADQNDPRVRAFVKIQDGCDNTCTFCIVRVARGTERSRSIADVVAEVQDLSERGYREVVLTGVHIGGYGSDLGLGLEHLIDALIENTDVPRIRLGSLEPWKLNEQLASRWAQSDRLCPHLHLPLQSGSDPVLKRMARRCPTDQFREVVGHIRAARPQMVLTTDLMVGFPGETEEEHAQSLAFAAEIGFAHMHIFAWSPRDGTAANRLPDRVSESEKRRRSQVAHLLGARMKRDHLAATLGQQRPVLWETVSAHPQGQTWTGYTDTYLRVETDVGPDIDLRNQIVPTQITGFAGTDRLKGIIQPESMLR